MKSRLRLTPRGLFLWAATLVAFFASALTAQAQVSVTVGAKVTDASNLVSGNAYLIKYTSMTGTPYITEGVDGTIGSYYSAPNSQNSPTQASVFYFISDNGNWKIENAYTGNYWPTPSANATLVPTTAANAGSWSISISSGTATLTCNNYGLDRLSNPYRVVSWSSRKTVEIYEVSATTLAGSSSYSDFSGKDIEVSSTAAPSISEGQWYVMSQRTRTSYVFENTSDHKLKHTQTKPSGSATEKAGYLMRLLSADGGKYYLQNGLGNYMGAIAASANVPTTALGEEAVTVAKIASTDGHFYLQGTTNGVVLDGNDFTGGDPSTVVGWGTSAPSATGGNNDWAFYPVTFVASWDPAVTEVYTINNTNTNRGAMMYNGSSNYVWSSGKSGTFDAANANCQWVFVPTGTTGQYYLYNVGADKFAIPSGTASTNSWVFSNNAVAVSLIRQGDGTYKIKTATTDTYAAVSNGYAGPIINYNDAGGNFTITQVSGGDASSAANAAVANLVDSQTALTAIPADGTSDWYVIRIKTHGTYADKYIYPAANEIEYSGTNYPLTFDHGANVRPAIDDVTYYTRITNESNNFYWQMPNGKYLYGSGNKFPISTFSRSTFSMYYTSGSGVRMSGSSRYAVPYLLGSQYFIGETASSGNAYYDFYPINLTTAGLQPWQVTITNGSSSTQLECTRSDVSGLTAVYNNGYFFLPTGVTPLDTDFSLVGMVSCTVDATNHTITATFDPELSITINDISVIQGNQVTGKGNTMQALLRIKATPFSDFQPTQFTINLTGAAQVDNVKVYSTTSDQIRFAGVTPTLLGTTASPSNGTVNISVTSSSIAAGTSLYYWVTADVKSSATEWETIDASISSISYTNAYKEANGLSDTQLDISSIGNPTGEMRIYKRQNTLWTSSKSNAKYYRIPALLKTGTNTLLAFTDDRYANHGDLGGNHKIDVLVKKSTDGGATWGNAITVAAGDGSTAAGYGYGDAAVAQAANGDIVCLMAAGNTSYGSGMLHIGYTKSTDGGATWSSPIDIYGNTNYLTNPHTFQSTFVSSGHGITQTIANSGRIAFPALGKISGTTNEYVFYSDDNGATWTFTDNYGYTDADESKLLELNDGKLLMSIRTGYFSSSNVARGYNRTTDTNVEHWGTQGTWSDLLANGCNSDLIYYIRSTDPGATRDVMLHSVVKSYSNSHRKDLRLYMSFDEGNTWNEAFQLQPGWAAYSSMQVLDNGDLAILFEDGSIGNEDENDNFDINYVVISKELMDARIEELNPISNDVKIIYGNNAETYYGSWDSSSKNTWTSNDTTNPVAGVTLTRTGGGSFGNYNSVTGYTDLFYYLGSGSATLTLTAPEGYVITGYSAKLRQGQNNTASYTVTAEDGTSVSPVFAGAIENYTDFNVTGLSTASTDITVSNTNNANALCFVNFVVSLQPAVDFIVVDVSGNELARERKVCTTNVVEDEMSTTNLKRAFCSYSYFSDANHTTSISTIDDRTAVYALCAVNAPFTFSTVENPIYYNVYGHKKDATSTNNFYLYANGTSLGFTDDDLRITTNPDAFQWAIIGNPYNVQIVNKATGKPVATSALAAGSGGANVTTAVSDDDTTYPYNTFSLYGFIKDNVTTTNPFSLVLNGSSYSWLDATVGSVKYHSGIQFDSSQRIKNWETANLMVATPSTVSTVAVKVADGTSTNGPDTYGDAGLGSNGDRSAATDTWTSNATSGLAGVTITSDHDAFLADKTDYSSYDCLAIIPSSTSAETYTITAPDGYKIYGYSISAGYWTSSENYTFTASEGTGTTTGTTSTAPVSAVTLVSVRDINKKSTTFTMTADGTTRFACVKAMYIYLTEDESGWMTIRDDRQKRFMYAAEDGFVRTSRTINHDNLSSATWKLVPRAVGQYDIVNADGKYINPASVSATDKGATQNYYKTSDSQPAGYWTRTPSTKEGCEGAYTILSSVDNGTMHVLNYNDVYGVVKYGSAGNENEGCQMFMEDVRTLPAISDNSSTTLYTIQSSRSGHEALAQNAVGEDFAGVAIATTDLNQQWKFTVNSTSGYNVVSAGFAQYINGDGVAYNGDLTLTDAEPDAGWTIGYIYDGTYLITNGSTQVHGGGSGHNYKIKNWGSGTRYDDNCNLTIAEAPAPVEQLTSGWYQVKYHKNPATGSVLENSYAGRYLYNDEQWTTLTNNGSRTLGNTAEYVGDQDFVGFMPIRVDATASQPDADDATYYIWIDKDDSDNIQIMSSNGHWIGNCGMANNDSPKKTNIEGYNSSKATTNMLGAFDLDGYNFVVKYDDTDAYLTLYETTPGETAGKVLCENDFIPGNTEQNPAVGRVWSTNTNAIFAGNRFLVRPVNIEGVGLTPYTVTERAYPVGSDKYDNSVTHTYQHWSTNVTLSNDVQNVSGVRTAYTGGTLFTKNSELLESSDLTGGPLSDYWQNTAHVKVVPGVVGYTILMVDTHIDETVARGKAAVEGQGVGYPVANHPARLALETVDYTKAWNEYTDEELLTIAMYADDMFDESNIANLNMPVEGHAYSFKLMKQDGTTPKYLRYNQLNADRTEASSGIELADVPASGVIPEDGWFIGKQLSSGRYAFVTISGKYVAYANNSGQGVYTDGVSDTYLDNGYLEFAKFPYSSSHISTTDVAVYGKVYINGYRTSGGSSHTGTIIVNESTSAFDKSDAPYLNGSYTSAFVVEEHAFINQDVRVNNGGDGYYTTLYLPFSVELPDGATAAGGVINTAAATIDMVDVTCEDGEEKTVLPKNTPVVIKFDSNPADGKYTFVPALTPGVALTSNDLSGTLVTIPTVANAYTFAKGKTSGVLGFYKYTGSTLKEGKAYLIYNKGGDMPGFALNFNGSATGVESVEIQTEGKQYFDLQGRRVAQPQKGGIYILNGKKVLVK